MEIVMSTCTKPQLAASSDSTSRATSVLMLAGTIGLAVLYAPVVYAQPVEEIVISASRREQRSFDAPAAVQTVTSEALREAGPQVNLSEALSRVPGVVVLNRQNYSQDLQMSIRGFGARSSFGIRGVRLLIDGIPATTPDGQGQASTFSLPFTERLEVLRGPLAQLYGNAAGGVVQAFTREPGPVPQAEASVYFGSNSVIRTDWQYLTRFGGAGLGLAFDYNTFKTDGWRDHSEAKRSVANLKLGYDTKETKVVFTASHFDQPKAQDPLGLNSAELAANPRQVTPVANTANTGKAVDQTQFGLRLEQSLGGYGSLGVRLYTGGRNLDNPLATQWVTLDRSFNGLGVLWNGKTAVSGLPLTWALGFDRDRMTERRNAYTNTAGVRGAAFNRDEDSSASNTDYFAQASLNATENVAITAGLRKSSIQLSSQDYYLADGRNGTGSVNYSATKPVLGVVWSAAPTLNLYANWGRGLETPTLSEIAYRVAGTAVIGEFNPALNAARSTHVELGLKWQPSRSTRVDAALFNIKTADELVPLRTSSGQSVFQNAGNTRRQGLELSATTQLSDTFSLRAALTHTDAEFTSAFSRVIGTATTVIAAGNKLPAVPKQLLSTEITWRPSKFSRVGLEWVAASRLWANDTNTAYAGGYGVLNLGASHTMPVGSMNLTLHARIDNLANRNYVGSVIVNEAGQRFFEPAQGRNWLIGATLRGSF
jgi:iron complex outermembrane recepter protein